MTIFTLLEIVVTVLLVSDFMLIFLNSMSLEAIPDID
jgi:hypothetical protein